MSKGSRALCRWALNFVDHSSLNDQIKLIAELNKMKIEVNVSKVQFAMHMISLLEMWLQKEGTNIKEPAEYYQRLLMSMPTEPECALVRVRSKITDMIEESSPILRDLDGENGFFARIKNYADWQGVKGDAESQVKKEGQFPKLGDLHAMQEAADQCAMCRSWICRKLDKNCICQHDSTYDIDKIPPGPKKEFVELNRDYRKENPGASLLIEAYDMRRSLKYKPKSQGQLSHMGVGLTAEDELESWLADHNGGRGDGLFVLGSDESPVRASYNHYQSPLTSGNCESNPALDPPRPLNNNYGLITPKRLFSDFNELPTKLPTPIAPSVKVMPDASVAEEPEGASKGGGGAQIEIVQYILHLALAGAGRVTATASDLSKCCINLPKSQLATIALAVYAFHHKIKPTLRTLFDLVASAYLKLGAGPQQRLRAIFIKIKSTIAQRLIK